MAEGRYTKRDMFTEASQIVALASASELVSDEVAERVAAGLAHEVELLTKKRSSKGKADVKRAEAAAAIQADIASVLETSDEGMRATDIAAALDDTTVQKVTAHVAKMVAAGTVIRSEDKKVVTFTLA